MKSFPTIIMISLPFLLILSSCVSRKNLTYLQYSGAAGELTGATAERGMSVTPSDYKIMPFDNLYIRVITPDPQWSALFNLDSSTGGVTLESAALAGYIVDMDGNIEIPFVGKVYVLGKTLSEIKANLDSVFKNYLTDAAITVRLVQNYISIIGEVRIPGRYLLPKDQVNIFEALSLAGDLTEYSNRQKVQLIRPSPYGPIIKELTLKDRSILSSEFYFIKPNDIIYAMPVQGRAFQLNSTILSLFLTTITSTLGVLAFFRTF